MPRTKPTKNNTGHRAVFSIGEPLHREEHEKAGLPEFTCSSGNARDCGPRCKGRQAAWRYADKQERDYKRGRYIDENDPTTVAQHVRHYVERKHTSGEHRDTTARRNDSMIRNHVEGSAFGSLRLATVWNPTGVNAYESWVDEMFTKVGRTGKRLGNEYARDVIALVRAALAEAVRKRILSRSPAPDRLEGGSGSEIKPVEEVLSPEQAFALRDEMIEWYPDEWPIVALIAQAGLRPGEALGLRVTDVDWRAGRPVIRVREQVTDGKRTAVLKTDRSRREVPIDHGLIEILAAHRHAVPAALDGALFHRDGRVWSDHEFRRHFKIAARAAGLPDEDWVVPHACRHFYASVLLRGGVDIAEVARRLGDTITVVQKVYAHMIPNTGDRTRDAVAAVWG